jgi:hypothetical protein
MKRVVLLALLACAGCRRHRMTAEDCRLVLDRITEIELHEAGFRDPVLLARRQAELRARFAPELAACQGKRVRRDALDCIRQARTAEVLSHRCLR